jgi:hypothetical protein
MEQRILRKRQRNLQKTEKLNSHATEQASLLTVALPHSFLVSAVLTCFSDSFAFYEAANFVSVQLLSRSLVHTTNAMQTVLFLSFIMELSPS